MTQHARICAEINLDHFVHNLEEAQRLLSPGSRLCAVIKADGYGHGALPLARIMEHFECVWGYAVATAQEALSLKESGVKKPILILGYVFEEDLAQIVRSDIRPTVFSAGAAAQLSDEAVRAGRTVKIHVKIDTGMGRIGFSCAENDLEHTAEEIARIAALPSLKIEGIFTHFSMADAADKTFAFLQAERFLSLLAKLKEKGVEIPMRHISNSAALIDLPQYNLDLVRAGILLYGLWPSEEVQKVRIDLRALMTLKSHVIQVKQLSDGAPVSYGGTYRAHGTETIATIPVGYADGYPRTLSNIGSVLIHGKRAPICGRICMDQFMVNVSDIPDVRPGDEVILIGSQGEEEITMEELGNLSGRFNYEFACDIGKRVPRIYLGKQIPNDVARGHQV